AFAESMSGWRRTSTGRPFRREKRVVGTCNESADGDVRPWSGASISDGPELRCWIENGFVLQILIRPIAPLPLPISVGFFGLLLRHTIEKDNR
ncbi:MAG: hypothetical protein WCA22_11435, partial [Candidatus Binatus sp.]